jgi:hypothetical protein
MELQAAAAVQIKMVELQELQQRLVEVEQVLRAAQLQLEIQIVRQRDLCLAMVHIYKVALLAVWPVLKAAVVEVVVTTAAAAVLIKLDQSMAAAAVVQAT